MNYKVKEVTELINSHQTIILHRHSFPDGDAIGSQAGMKFLLQENFPDKRVLITGDAPARYSFIEGSTPDVLSDADFCGALCIILDTPERAMLSDDRIALADATVRFDHHIFKEKWCDLEVIDDAAESCCGLVTGFAEEAKLKINALAANALYSGMVTDSGRFRYDSVTSSTMRRAAVLLDCGADAQSIFSALYKEELSRVKMRASFLTKAQFTENGVGYLFNTAEEVAALGVDTFTVSRGMVNVMADIKGVDIWVNFTENGDGKVLCELRSSGCDINPIAVKYGGGGHKKASGATLENFEVAKRMLAELDETSKKLHNGD